MKPIISNADSPQQLAALIIDQTLLQAATYHQAGQLADAEELYLGILQVDPAHPDANYNLGLMAMQLGKAEMGLHYLQVAWEADPSIEQYWLTLTECLLEMGHSEDALLLLEEAIRRGMQSPQARQLLERAKGNHYDKTRPAGNVAEEAAPSNLTIPNKARLAKLGKPARNPTLRQQKDHNSQGINAMAALFNEGRYAEAAELAQTMTERFPHQGFGWKALGVAFKQMGRNADALVAMQKAAALSQGDFEVHFNLGIILKDLSRLDEAEASFRKALLIKQDSEAHNDLGNALKDMGRLGEAEASYRMALKIKPEYAEVYNNLAIVLLLTGRQDEAEACLRCALQLKPDFAEAHNNLGNILRAMGQLNNAEVFYRRALEINPNYAEAHSNLGNTLKDMGWLGEAEISYRRSLQVKPDYAQAHYNLGIMLKEMGRLDEALASCRLAIKAKKDDWKDALRRLTTPPVLTTGMVTESYYPVSSTESRKQAIVLKEQENTPRVSVASLPASHDSLLEEVQPKPEVAKKLRIILIYPPPWQILSPGEPVSGMPFGPPGDRNDCNLDDADFQTITYGLLTIAAQAKRAGYEVSIYNLATCPWRGVATLIAETEADVYGISAFTANRRGMGAVAALIRQHHPQAHITVGGPFVTALPEDTLRYYQDIDTAVIGEGEETFMELLERVGSGRLATGIPGTAWRNGDLVVVGATRPRIKDLNTLASPFDYFTSHIVMTSRGCPSKCTFCGSFTTWGKLLRFHSAESCLDIFSKALARLPVPFMAIKDDTFTAHRRRTIAICDAIIENKMNFIWSCDTRVDSIDDELLCKMRLAGCQTISLGVESGSTEILKAIRKETSPEMVLDATRSAQKYGMHVRYYMILGSRGETPETIQQSVELIKAGRPNRYFFSTMSYFPGTEDWAILREKQGLTPDIFFTNDFKELNAAANRNRELQDIMLYLTNDIGAIYGFDYTVEEREAVVGRMPHLHVAHVELANAYFRAGRLDEAELALNRAEELEFPISGLIYNQRACIALAHGEIASAIAILEHAVQCYPHHVVMKNLKNLRGWVNAPVNKRGKPPVLSDSVQAMDFYLQSQSTSAHPLPI